MRRAGSFAPILVALLLTSSLVGCGAHHVEPPTSVTDGASTPAPSSPVPPGSTSRSGSPTPRHLMVRTVRWRLPAPVAREAVVATPRGLVVAGGLVSGDRSTATSYLLDPTTGHVQSLPSLPVAVHDTAGIRLGGRPVVVGGGNVSEQDSVQVGRGSDWSVIGHLPQARSDLTVVQVSARALVLGGYDSHAPALADILTSRDGTTWPTIGTLPVPVRYGAGVLSGHSVWLFGGERSGVEQRVVQRIDPKTGHAGVVAQLPMPLGHASAISIGRRVLLVGGRTDPHTTSSRMWWFDPRRRTFTPAGHLPFPLADSAVAVTGPVAYLLGGESPSVTDRVLRFTLH